jgi:hypothetical protein
MDRINVDIIRLANSQPDGAKELPLPSYETAGAAGMDLAAALSAPIDLGAGKRTIIPLLPMHPGQLTPIIAAKFVLFLLTLVTIVLPLTTACESPRW